MFGPNGDGKNDKTNRRELEELFYCSYRLSTIRNSQGHEMVAVVTFMNGESPIFIHIKTVVRIQSTTCDLFYVVNKTGYKFS